MGNANPGIDQRGLRDQGRAHDRLLEQVNLVLLGAVLWDLPRSDHAVE